MKLLFMLALIVTPPQFTVISQPNPTTIIPRVVVREQDKLDLSLETHYREIQTILDKDENE